MATYNLAMTKISSINFWNAGFGIYAVGWYCLKSWCLFSSGVSCNLFYVCDSSSLRVYSILLISSPHLKKTSHSSHPQLITISFQYPAEISIYPSGEFALLLEYAKSTI